MLGNRYLDKVIDRVEAREVVGVVHDRDALEALEQCLMEHGFDRGDIDIMAGGSDVDGAPSTETPNHPREAPDYERHEVLTYDDDVGAHVLSYGTLIAVGSIAGAIPVLAAGGGATALAFAIVGGGALGGGVGRIVRNRIVGARARKRLEADIARCGIAVLVHVYDDDDQARALRQMRECGAEMVHVHNVEMTKTLHEVPFASMKPDPWLSPERLGG